MILTDGPAILEPAGRRPIAQQRREELREVDGGQGRRGRGDAVQRAGGETHDPYGRVVRRRRVGQPEPPQELHQPLLDLSAPAGRVLGLDGELDGPPRVGDQLQEPFEGEDGGVLGVAPVRALPRVLPRAEVERRKIGEFQAGNRPAAVGGAVDAPVVHADEVAVRGEPHIALQGVRPVLYGLHVGGEGVFRRVLGRAAVGDHLDGVRACVGHRVMVPPLHGPLAGSLDYPGCP